MRGRAIAVVCVFLVAGCAGSDSDDPSAEPVIRNAPSGQASAPPFDPQTDRTEAVAGFVPSTFAVIGDFGTGDARQYAVKRRMCRWREKNPFDHVFTTGDNIYPDGDPALFEERFFEPYDCLFRDDVRFHVSLGNHDIVTKNGLPQIRRPAFGIPRRNYVFRTKGIRFVVADSNDLNYRWLKKKTRAEEGDHWTIVLFHHPVYSAGTTHGSTPGFASTLRPLFERRGVDLVLNGHDHLYSATKELKGIRYVVTGGGGARSYGCDKAPPVVRCKARLHFLYVRATATHLEVTAIPARGRPIHRFTTRGRA
ncbi:MAG: metallophosphoesterase family protein [Actinomycetota bacterium]